MPTPEKRERKKNFIKRCISFLYNEEPEALNSKKKKNKQAYAICNSIYDREKKRNKKMKNIKTYEQFNNF